MHYLLGGLSTLSDWNTNYSWPVWLQVVSRLFFSSDSFSSHGSFLTCMYWPVLSWRSKLFFCAALSPGFHHQNLMPSPPRSSNSVSSTQRGRWSLFGFLLLMLQAARSPAARGNHRTQLVYFLPEKSLSCTACYLLPEKYCFTHFVQF